MTVYGNTEVVAALHQMVASGHVPHALLLHEDDGGGAFPLCINFLEELYGGSPRVQKLIHPDIHFVFPVAGSDKPVSMQFLGKFRELALENPYFFENELYTAIGIEGKQGNISVNEARSILDRLSLSAVEGGYRTVLVYLPEKMNAQAANALLKMVEEPPGAHHPCAGEGARDHIVPLPAHARATLVAGGGAGGACPGKCVQSGTYGLVP